MSSWPASVHRSASTICVASRQACRAADAAREVARIAREAVLALAEGRCSTWRRSRERTRCSRCASTRWSSSSASSRAKFRAGEIDKAVSYYVSLGNDEQAKWTVRVDGQGCQVKPGKPEGGQADCVLKTSPEIFSKIVRESYVPSPADFLSGAVKSNDVSLLMTFQKVFQLDQPS